MNLYQTQFLGKTSQAAEEAGHIFPTMAACEAALESSFGVSGLAIHDNNLFGMKQHAHPIYGTHSLPTREFLNNAWVVVEANWIHYPTVRDCFIDRMNTLKRLAPHYAHYADALAAQDEIDYVTAVSQSWSSDPRRAEKVIEIYKEWLG